VPVGTDGAQGHTKTGWASKARRAMTKASEGR
jgi:hypothetical protein